MEYTTYLEPAIIACYLFQAACAAQGFKIMFINIYTVLSGLPDKLPAMPAPPDLHGNLRCLRLCIN